MSGDATPSDETPQCNPDAPSTPRSVEAGDLDAFVDNTTEDDRLQDIDDADPLAPLKDPFPPASQPYRA